MKTITMLIFATCLAAFAFHGPPPPNRAALRGASVDDKDVIKAAKFAVDAEQKAMKDAGQSDALTLVKIVSARKQVVAGMNYILKLQVKQGDKARTAEVKVWWQAWRGSPYQLTSWKFVEGGSSGDEKPAEATPPTRHQRSTRVSQETRDCRPVVVGQIDHAATAANNGFAIDLYRQLAKEKQGKDLFFSPYSMISALAMTAEGRTGETASQMGKVLCFPESARRIRRGRPVAPLEHGRDPRRHGRGSNARFNPKPAAPESARQDRLPAARNWPRASNRRSERWNRPTTGIR